MANQRLKATVEIGSVIERSVKKNIGIIRSGLEGVGDEIKTVTDRQKELSKQRKVLEKQGRSVAELDREYEGLGRQLDTLRRKQAAWTRAAQASQRVGAAFGDTVRTVGRVAKTTAAAVGGASALIVGSATSTAKAGDKIAKTADRLGIGVEAYQELAFAADRSGISNDKFATSMEAFTKRLGEAKDGSGEAADAIKTLGLNANELAAMDTQDALGAIADKMKEIGDPALQNALTADLFSRGGQEMLNLLRNGSEEMRALAEEGRNVGAVLSEDTVRGGEDFQDKLTDFQSVVVGLKNTIGAELMPVVGDAMEQFSTFMVENRDQVKEFAKDFADGVERIVPKIGDLLENMGSFASGVGDIVKPIGRAAKKISDLVGGVDNAGAIIGGLFAAKFIGAAFASTPLGLAITALTVAGAAIYENWDEIKVYFKRTWDKIGAVFEKAWGKYIEPVTDKIANAADAIVNAWQNVKSGLGAVMEWLGEKFDWLARKLEPIINGLTFLRDKGAAAVGSVFGGDDGPTPGSQANHYPQGHPLHKPQKRAVGGTFRPGGLLVGEQGSELRYEDRSGFIANNRATERIASLAAGARANIESAAGAMAGAAARVPVTVNMTNQIDARGMSQNDLVEALERLQRKAQESALFDGPRGYGQYGGVV